MRSVVDASSSSAASPLLARRARGSRVRPGCVRPPGGRRPRPRPAAPSLARRAPALRRAPVRVGRGRLGRRGQEHLDRRCRRRARVVDRDEPAAALDDAEHRRQAQAGALADPLGGEERLEQVRLDLGRHPACRCPPPPAARSARPGDRGPAAGRPRRMSTAAVAMRSVPPPGMASRPLSARFSSTCSSCAGSPPDRRQPGASAISTRMFSPMRRSSIWLARWTTWLRSSSLGFEHRLAAEQQQLPGQLRRPLAGVADGDQIGVAALVRRRRRPAASLTQLLMTVSRLLKSWAMPPASCPMACIFCDWRSCSSSRFRSVMSRPLDSTSTSCARRSKIPRLVHCCQRWPPGTSDRCSSVNSGAAGRQRRHLALDVPRGTRVPPGERSWSPGNPVRGARTSRSTAR